MLLLLVDELEKKIKNALYKYSSCTERYGYPDTVLSEEDFDNVIKDVMNSVHQVADKSNTKVLNSEADMEIKDGEFRFKALVNSFQTKRTGYNAKDIMEVNLNIDMKGDSEHLANLLLNNPTLNKDILLVVKPKSSNLDKSIYTPILSNPSYPARSIFASGNVPGASGIQYVQRQSDNAIIDYFDVSRDALTPFYSG